MSIASFRPFLCALLVLIFGIPNSLYAQGSHVVSPAELQANVKEVSWVREQNRSTLRAFLASREAREAIRSTRVSPEQVEQAIPSLSDAELAQLAARASHAQKDFAAGALSREALLIVVIAVVVVIIIVAVKA
ncbi:MAG: hypothetical protein DMG91_15870 [Acidobacteria bacterium]|nr:MAG: hypothetical protein DMG91_15870 [Acidobacteriota bacterium]